MSDDREPLEDPYVRCAWCHDPVCHEDGYDPEWAHEQGAIYGVCDEGPVCSKACARKLGLGYCPACATFDVLNGHTYCEICRAEETLSSESV